MTGDSDGVSTDMWVPLGFFGCFKGVVWLCFEGLCGCFEVVFVGVFEGFLSVFEGFLSDFGGVRGCFGGVCG